MLRIHRRLRRRREALALSAGCGFETRGFLCGDYVVSMSAKALHYINTGIKLRRRVRYDTGDRAQKAKPRVETRGYGTRK